MNRYLNIHMLTPTNAANANRDDTGAPKSVSVGGVERHRWSSQAQKRAKRVAFETRSPEDRSVRSRRLIVGDMDQALRRAIGGLTANQEKQATKAESDLSKATAKAADAMTKLTALIAAPDSDPKQISDAEKAVKTTADDVTRKEKAVIDGGSQKDTIIWLSNRELSKAAEKAGTDSDLFAHLAGKTTSLAIAAFGRMYAARPDLELEAAVQTAHAFTTHQATLELDYFTAVDDRPTSADGSGSAHMGLKMLASGVFYQHLCVDRDQLLRNWTDTGRADANERLSMLFEALLATAPKGMKATAPVDDLPAFIYLAATNAPVSLAAAFEQPVQPAEDGGYLLPSIERLASWADRVVAFRGQPADAWWATTADTGAAIGTAVQVPGLPDLVKACTDWIS